MEVMVEAVMVAFRMVVVVVTVAIFQMDWVGSEIFQQIMVNRGEFRQVGMEEVILEVGHRLMVVVAVVVVSVEDMVVILPLDRIIFRWVKMEWLEEVVAAVLIQVPIFGDTDQVEMVDRVGREMPGDRIGDDDISQMILIEMGEVRIRYIRKG